jgi:UDP-N-acetylmuramate dehydrogenase
VTVAAGEEWDGVVASCTEWELAGLECLSGIPGLAGATPIQNVGAYGQEVAESITAVRAYDRESGKVVILSPEDCGFGYRTSALKRSMTIWEGPHPDADRGRASHRPQAAGFTGRFVVLAVSFLLMPDRLSWPVRYSELAKALDVGEGGRAPLADVRAAVLSLRRGKGMVVDPADPDSRSAGSFFTNPVLSVAQFEALEEAVAGRCGPGTPIPRFPAGPGAVKVPAAWLISQAGFQKGYQPGASPGENAARISTKHSLALVNPGGATASGVVGLAREIRNRVRDMFGVDLSVEPILVGLSL